MASRSEGEPLQRAFRVADTRHRIFDPTGARLGGGRWNSPGKGIIYAAETYAGALLEALIHLNFDDVPEGYGWIEIAIRRDTAVEEVSPAALPGWNGDDLTPTRRFGDRWYDEKRTPLLLVPSVATAGVERNVLINPDHPQRAAIRAGEVREVIWDQRLFGR